MNSKIALSLIFGLILSILVAYFTADQVDSYNSNTVKVYNDRLSKETEIIGETVGKTLVKSETVYNSTLILVGFAGGFGIGFLLADKIKL